MDASDVDDDDVDDDLDVDDDDVDADDDDTSADEDDGPASDTSSNSDYTDDTPEENTKHSKIELTKIPSSTRTFASMFPAPRVSEAEAAIAADREANAIVVTLKASDVAKVAMVVESSDSDTSDEEHSRGVGK